MGPAGPDISFRLQIDESVSSVTRPAAAETWSLTRRTNRRQGKIDPTRSVRVRAGRSPPPHHRWRTAECALGAGPLASHRMGGDQTNRGQRPCRLVELVLVHVVRLLVDPQIRPREQRWQSLLVRAHPEKHTPPSQFGPLRVTALDAEHNLTSARGLVDPFLDVDDQPLPPP